MSCHSVCTKDEGVGAWLRSYGWKVMSWRKSVMHRVSLFWVHILKMFTMKMNKLFQAQKTMESRMEFSHDPLPWRANRLKVFPFTFPQKGDFYHHEN